MGYICLWIEYIHFWIQETYFLIEKIVCEFGLSFVYYRMFVFDPSRPPYSRNVLPGFTWNLVCGFRPMFFEKEAIAWFYSYIWNYREIHVLI